MIRILPATLIQMMALFFWVLRRFPIVLFSSRRGIIVRQLWLRWMQVIQHTLFLIAALALLINLFMISQLKSWNQEGAVLEVLYAQFFSSVVVLEFAPIFCGFLLVAQSGVVILAELLQRKRQGELLTLKMMRIEPLELYLLPIIIAFSVGLLMMYLWFDLIGMVTGFFLLHEINPSLQWSYFAGLIIKNISVEEWFFHLLKGVVGGCVVALSLFSAHGMRGSTDWHEGVRLLKQWAAFQVTALFSVTILLSLLSRSLL